MKGQNIMLFCVPCRKEIERSVEIDKQIEEKGNTIKITYEYHVIECIGEHIYPIACCVYNAKKLFWEKRTNLMYDTVIYSICAVLCGSSYNL